MVSLIVEASNGVCSIACFEEKNILAEKNFVCSNNLSAVILEEIDRVKTYRVDKIELELDKINGKWEITKEN